MKYLPLLLAVLLVAAVYLLFSRKRKYQEDHDSSLPSDEKRSRTKQELTIPGAYQKRWMFTYNEKDAYSKLKPIADELGLILFAKVRLLDLVEPMKGQKQYKAYFHKVQSKHVDFVLCDQKLVAKYIIELDDKSHEREDRKQRDAFVDEVVTSVGYKILHVYLYEINDSLKERLSST